MGNWNAKLYLAGDARMGVSPKARSDLPIYYLHLTKCFIGGSQAHLQPSTTWRACAHDGVLSARWKSVRGFYRYPEIE